MKSPINTFLCPRQWCVNGVLIDEVPKFLAPIHSEIMHAIQLENPFDATYPIMEVTNYLKVRKPTEKEYKNQNIVKIELMMEAPS